MILFKVSLPQKIVLKTIIEKNSTEEDPLKTRIQIIVEIQDAIIKDDISAFQELIKITLDFPSDYEQVLGKISIADLFSLYKAKINENMKIKEFVTTALQHNSLAILKYLLEKDYLLLNDELLNNYAKLHSNIEEITIANAIGFYIATESLMLELVDELVKQLDYNKCALFLFKKYIFNNIYYEDERGNPKLINALNKSKLCMGPIDQIELLHYCWSIIPKIEINKAFDQEDCVPLINRYITLRKGIEVLYNDSRTNKNTVKDHYNAIIESFNETYQYYLSLQKQLYDKLIENVLKEIKKYTEFKILFWDDISPEFKKRFKSLHKQSKTFSQNNITDTLKKMEWLLNELVVYYNLSIREEDEPVNAILRQILFDTIAKVNVVHLDYKKETEHEIIGFKQPDYEAFRKNLMAMETLNMEDAKLAEKRKPKSAEKDESKSAEKEEKSKKHQKKQ